MWANLETRLKIQRLEHFWTFLILIELGKIIFAQIELQNIQTSKIDLKHNTQFEMKLNLKLKFDM